MHDQRPLTIRVPARSDGMPPHNIEVEMKFLACIIMHNDCIDEVANLVSVDDLFRDTHQIIYRTALELHSEGTPFDGLVLEDRLSANGTLERIGGHFAISSILDTVFFYEVEIQSYARIIAAHALRRSLIEMSNDTIGESQAQDETAEDIAARLEAKIADALNRHAPIRETSVGDAAEMAYARITRIKGGEEAAMSTGFQSLDFELSGLEASRLTIIGGRPGMGKSCLGLNFAEYAARFYACPVYIFSLEMSAEEVGKRFIASIARVHNDKLKGKIPMTAEETRRVAAAVETLRNLPIKIDDSSVKTAVQILSQAKLAKRRHGSRLIVVDHIGLIKSESKNRTESRQQHLGNCSRTMKQIARDLQIPVIAMAQLNRNNTDRQDKRPTISDLRESGDIEQDADNVLLIHREGYYDDSKDQTEAEIIIGKQRDGNTGTVKLAFFGHFSRFDNVAPYQDDQAPADQPWN
mgnify:CR=1 FL=1